MAYYKGKKELTEKEMKEWIHNIITSSLSKHRGYSDNTHHIHPLQKITPLPEFISTLYKLKEQREKRRVGITSPFKGNSL